MRAYSFRDFGLEHLKLAEHDTPPPKTGEVVVDLKALSLNYRDLLVITGGYNPKLKLPATPLSDGAGVVSEVGPGVEQFQPGDRVVTHFVPAWKTGPFRFDYLGSTLGTPGAGLAAEQVALPADGLLQIPDGMDFATAATLPIAALTAWSALHRRGNLPEGGTVLTLGTGGVSVFALQLAKAGGARVVVTSSSDQKLARAKELGADHTINYEKNPEWHKEVLKVTEGGADVVVECAGGATLNQSLQATRANGTVSFLGALTGLEAGINAGLLMMKELNLRGLLVGPRDEYRRLLDFIQHNNVKPVIDATFGFAELPEALRHMESGRHFGKIVITLAE